MYKIYGQSTECIIQQNDLDPFDTLIDEAQSVAVLTQSSRGETDLIELGELEDYDVVNIEYEDGGTWMFTVEQYKAYVITRQSRGGQDLIIEPYLDSGTRGFGKIGERIIEFIKFKVIGKSIKEIARKVEELTVMGEEGLFKVNNQLEFQGSIPNDVAKDTYLLLLHGTISNTRASFSGLKENGKFNEIYKHYNGNILALQHKTLTKSIFNNVEDLLDQLPNNIELDILSQSRGGLIGEILNVLSETPESVWSDDDNQDLVSRLKIEDLREKFLEKNITINKFIRVACPAAGTSLLGDSVSNFLQVFNNATKILEQGAYGKLFKYVKFLIAVIIKQKDNPDVLPGIYPMVPYSDFIETLNTSDYYETPLFVISGNIQKNNIKNSIKFILTYWIYDQANDLVVDKVSMIGGLRRVTIAEYHYPNSITHFDYFKTPLVQSAIQRALVAPIDATYIEGFEVKIVSSDSRGLLNMGETPKNPKKEELGTKPIMVLIPGILGSTLSLDKELLWVKAIKLFKGGLAKIDLRKNKDIEATGGIGDAYNKMVNHFKERHDVIVFPFDWRKSIDIAGKDFITLIQDLFTLNVQIHIVAHSMGGLVARAFMIKEPDLQKKLQYQGGRILLLGTPWKGSYLIPQALNASGKRFNQLRKLAFCTFKKQSLLRVIAHFDGIYSLLPMYQEQFENIDVWTKLDQLKGDAVVPELSKLDWFRKYKKMVLKAEEHINYENVYYIAGYAPHTVDNYRIENNKAVFYADHKVLGDGSVTWDSGIPIHLSKRHVFYTHIEHGELCNAPSLFKGIEELLIRGNTRDANFTNRRENLNVNRSRGGLPQIFPIVNSNDPNEIIRDVLGLKTSHHTGEEPTKQTINVQIVNGDLKYSKYPVMIGHFHKDSIISAERYMDYLCEHYLSQRNRLGAYPGPIGTSFILPSENASNPGTMIIGLGYKQEINPQRLQYTVEQGIIEYLLHDQITDKQGISTLLVGSGYGNIVLSECINAILKGISTANSRYIEIFPEGNQIRNVEIIELYKEKAEQAYEFIDENRQIYAKDNIFLNRKLEAVRGRRDLSQHNKEKKWWITITVQNTDNQEDNKNTIEFVISSDIAKVNQNIIKVDVSLVDRLLGKIEVNTPWNADLIQAAFKILIPNELKLILNGNHSIIWVLDRFTAKYPWELLHFADFQNQPTSVSSGMIRQMIFKSNNKPVSYVNTKSFAVVADPILDPTKAPKDGKVFSQLAAAKREGELVVDLFTKKGYKNSSDLIGKTEKEIFPALLLNRTKVLHFACHGVIDYGPEKRTGIVINYDSFLTPEIIANFDYMPDFIFVNCCYSGFVGNGDQNQFSPNIGTTLIEKGVKAIIVGAWEVNDSAALYFAQEFYKHFLDLEYFGESVRKAREACFIKFGNVNTWGAYQCYGNQYYQLENVGEGASKERLYNLKKDILIDLEVILNDTALSIKRSYNNEKIRTKLNQLSSNIEQSQLRNATITEQEARIFAELGDYESAINLYEKMLHDTEPDYKVWSANFYKVIKSKHLVNVYLNKKPLKKAREQIVEDLYELLSEARSIYSRYNTKTNGIMYASIIKSYLMIIDASNYKPMSEGDPEDFKTYYRKWLKLLRNIYYDINITYKRKNRFDDSHALSLYVIISSLISNNVSQIKERISSEINEDLDIHLEGVYTSLNNQRKRDFWDEIKKINILEAQLSLLLATQKKEMDRIERKIKSIYQEAWKFGGSRRNLMAEIDQMKFMLKASELTNSYSKDLKKTLTRLKKFYEKLEKETFEEENVS